MHSTLYVIRFGFEDDTIEELMDEVNSFIDEYPYGNGDIDYFQSLNQMASMFNEHNDGDYYKKEIIDGLIERMSQCVDAEAVDANKLRFTKTGINKYFSNAIKNVEEFVNSIKTKSGEYDIEKFVSNRYHLIYGILNDEHPKYYSRYAGCEGEDDFLVTIYNKMKYDNVDEVTVTIEAVYDYHF